MRIDHFMWASLLPTPWVMRFATIFGAGYVKWAPGTVGSALGIFWYILIFTSISGFSHIFLLLVTLYFAAGICGEAATRIGVKDPGLVILDEFVVIPICFLGLQHWVVGGYAWLILPLGFGLFRLFDITKPWLIGKLDQIEGGWGILLDDVGAAAATCLLLHILFTTGLVNRLLGLAVAA